MLFRLAAVLVATTTVAFADPPGMTELQPVPEPVPSSTDAKDPNVALALSLGGAAASVGMVAIGAKTDSGALVAAGLLTSTISPSFGEWYSGQFLTLGMGIRALSTGVMFGALANACFDECGGQNETGVETAFVIGLLGYGAGMIYDIATAPSSARKYNDRHRPRVIVVPTAYPTATGPAPGMMLSGAF